MSPKGSGPELVTLTLTFDSERSTPNRFLADSKDPTRPDPSGKAPGRPMKPADAADLVRRGNASYAAFIRECRMAGATNAGAGAVPYKDYRLFLNTEEVGIGGVNTQE